MKKFLILAAMSLLATACGTSANTGAPVEIPTITMSCTASNCNSNNSFFAVMYLTAYTCDENSINFSVAASSSSSVTCTGSAGCQETFSDWVNFQGHTTTTVPTGTYNLCGIVANSTFTGSWSGNVRAVGQAYSKKIDDKTTTINVTTWQNY